MSFSKNLIQDLVSKGVKIKITGDYPLSKELHESTSGYEEGYMPEDDREARIYFFNKSIVPPDCGMPCDTVAVEIHSPIPKIYPLHGRKFSDDDIMYFQLEKGPDGEIIATIHGVNCILGGIEGKSLMAYFESLGYKNPTIENLV